MLTSSQTNKLSIQPRLIFYCRSFLSLTFAFIVLFFLPLLLLTHVAHFLFSPTAICRDKVTVKGSHTHKPSSPQPHKPQIPFFRSSLMCVCTSQKLFCLRAIRMLTRTHLVFHLSHGGHLFLGWGEAGVIHPPPPPKKKSKR